jgi:uracil-DNA glycosylase family 4
VSWRELVACEKRRSFANEEYWGKAVPNFGDDNADRLIVGLAPAAHGANRTGRMFTGDRSGEWLFRALHRAGVANNPTSVHADDGLKLHGALISAIVHCAPPDNKPTPGEIANCTLYLKELLTDRHWKSILCLGKTAWDVSTRLVGIRPKPGFGHGVTCKTNKGVLLVGSYHPSQQNTFTGRLTEEMLDEAIARWLT